MSVARSRLASGVLRSSFPASSISAVSRSIAVLASAAAYFSIAAGESSNETRIRAIGYDNSSSSSRHSSGVFGVDTAGK